MAEPDSLILRKLNEILGKLEALSRAVNDVREVRAPLNDYSNVATRQGMNSALWVSRPEDRPSSS